MMCDRRRKHWSLLNLCPKCLMSHQAPVQTHSSAIWFGQAPALANRERQRGGAGIWGRKGLEFVFFPSNSLLNSMNHGPPRIEIIHSHVDSSQISPLLFYLNQKDIQEHHLHLENGSRGQLLLLFSTNI